MTYEMYWYIFLGGAIASGIMLVISAVLFFTLRIPKVIGDLTGQNARKAIQNIRMQNEASGDKSYKSSAVNIERGKLTDKISQSGRIVPREDSPFGTGVVTEKISTQHLPPEMPAEATTVLDKDMETTILDHELGKTEVLCMPKQVESAYQAQLIFEIEYEITFIHTNDVIA